MYLFDGFNFIKTKLYNKEKQTKSRTTAEVKIKSIEREIKEAVETKNVNKLGSGRVGIWKMTLKVIWARPILGCGPDNLNNGLHRYAKEEIEVFIRRTGTDLDKAHNEYLQIAATIGLQIRSVLQYI